MKYVCLLFLLTISFCSCKRKEKNLNDRMLNVKVNLESKEKSSDKFLNCFNLAKYVKLESSKGSYIGNIESILVYKDRIFISDDNETVFIYSVDGKLINKLTKGRGPGEFQDLLDIQFDKENEELYAWSLIKKEMYVYDKNGIFKRSFNLSIPIVKFLIIDNRNIACYTNYAVSKETEADKNSHYQIFLVHKEQKEWEVTYKNRTFPKRFAQMITSAYGTTPFYQNNSEIYFMPPFETNAYLISYRDKYLEKCLSFDFGDNSIPDEFIEKKGLSNIFNELKRKGYMIGWGNFYIDEIYFCFTTMLDDVEKTVVCDINKHESMIYNSLMDNKNELLVHMISSINDKNLFVAITNPFEFQKQTFKDKTSLGYKLSKETNEFDNPILLLYERTKSH